MFRSSVISPRSAFAFAIAFAIPSVTFAQGETKTSTTIRMPEDGGPLPRAKMPEGGVDGPTGDKTPDKLPRADMPEGGANLHCHLHEHHGIEHSHCHDHEKSESHDHDHESDQHCHEHSHDGSTHEHCHGHEKGRAHEHEHPTSEHCHEHQHGSEAPHSHCHEEGDPDHAHHGSKPVGAEPTGQDCHEHDGETHCHESKSKAHDHAAAKTDSEPVAPDPRLTRPMTEVAGLKVRWSGFLRTIAEFVENDPRSAFIGRNDGFKLANARLELTARKGGFHAHVSFDAAVGERERFNDPNLRFGMRLRDAYMQYDLSRYADVTAGRFKAPYDIGALESSGARTFIDAPIATFGILPGLGNEVQGMGQDRQLGIMVSKSRLGLTSDGFDLGYALALTNGRTLGLALNDNDRPALFGRVSAYYDDWATLNVGGFTDARTVGELPDLFDEDVSGTEVSAIVRIEKLVLEGQLLFQTTSFDSDRPTVNTLGAHAQFAYTLWDVTFAYRFAWYEPNTQDIDDADQRTAHTIGLSYNVEQLPLLVMLNGTVSGEQQGRTVDNNRLTLMGQFTF